MSDQNIFALLLYLVFARGCSALVFAGGLLRDAAQPQPRHGLAQGVGGVLQLGIRGVEGEETVLVLEPLSTS